MQSQLPTYGDYCEAIAFQIAAFGASEKDAPKTLTAEFRGTDGEWAGPGTAPPSGPVLQIPLHRHEIADTAIYMAQMGGRCLIAGHLFFRVFGPDGVALVASRAFVIYRFVHDPLEDALPPRLIPLHSVRPELRTSAAADALVAGKGLPPGLTDITWQPGRLGALTAHGVKMLRLRDPLAEAVLALMEGAPGRMHLGWLLRTRGVVFAVQDRAAATLNNAAEATARGRT